MLAWTGCVMPCDCFPVDPVSAPGCRIPRILSRLGVGWESKRGMTSRGLVLSHEVSTKSCRWCFLVVCLGQVGRQPAYRVCLSGDKEQGGFGTRLPLRKTTQQTLWRGRKRHRPTQTPSESSMYRDLVERMERLDHRDLTRENHLLVWELPCGRMCRLAVAAAEGWRDIMYLDLILRRCGVLWICDWAHAEEHE